MLIKYKLEKKFYHLINNIENQILFKKSDFKNTMRNEIINYFYVKVINIYIYYNARTSFDKIIDLLLLKIKTILFIFFIYILFILMTFIKMHL